MKSPYVGDALGPRYGTVPMKAVARPPALFCLAKRWFIWILRIRAKTSECYEKVDALSVAYAFRGARGRRHQWVFSDIQTVEFPAIKIRCGSWRRCHRDRDDAPLLGGSLRHRLTFSGRLLRTTARGSCRGIIVRHYAVAP
jgi:hypothetical protein